MLLEIAKKPENFIKLAVGLISLLFEEVTGQVMVVEKAVAAEVVSEHNDLTKITGIGPTFARRLNEAGVYSYAKLATLTPDYVKEVAKVADWQGDPEEWIAQAKELA